MEYSVPVLEHFRHPRNAGALAGDATGVGSARVGRPEHGQVIHLQLAVDIQGVIQAVAFKAYGCPATIACASWSGDWARGRPLEQIGQLDSAAIAEALALPPLKIQCAVLAEQALRAAAADFLSRQP